MTVKALALTGAASFIVAGSAQAAFTGVTFDNVDSTGGLNTWRLYANFDDPTDQILAVSGNDTQALIFSTTSMGGLINDGGAFVGLKQEDFAASPLTGARDTWLTLRVTTFAGNDTDYSPTFLNNDGVTNVLVDGMTSFSDDNDGWFDSNPGTQETGTSIAIAQFTVSSVEGPDAGNISLSGNVDWVPGGNGDLTSTSFSVDTAGVPAPGVLALLGLAGLAGTRRRRG